MCIRDRERRNGNFDFENEYSEAQVQSPKGPFGSSARGESAEDIKKLTYLSKLTYEFLKENPQTTFSQVTSYLCGYYRDRSLNIEQKNVQRRGYDTLNVFLSLGIVRKTKSSMLELVNGGIVEVPDAKTKPQDVEARRKRVAKKRKQVKEKILQLIALKKLIAYNVSLELKDTCFPLAKKVHFPFLLLGLPAESVVLENKSMARILVTAPSKILIKTESHLLHEFHLTQIVPGDENALPSAELKNFLESEILKKILPMANPALASERKLFLSNSQAIEEEKGDSKHTLDFHIMRASQTPRAINTFQNRILESQYESQELYQQSPFPITPMLCNPEESEPHPSEVASHRQLFKQA
eukprot:TRINITY_DN8127_c0_g1_i1.p1 TRINITY_DN8127_c0_g1~~TRINITY_DN8127_c0_g1_i1.p1  ORF type:complete len:354 (-),score=45.60 TRINITY_DN8127_c0_g1_i1:32-1093(-)